MPFEDVSEVVRHRMSRIRKTNSKPELVVRRLAHQLGYRFRLHRRDLPGTPDLVFAGRRKLIFVHGCFWHQHDCRLGKKQPYSRQEYWKPKLTRNRARDAVVQDTLRVQGWDFLVVWECETKDQARLATRLAGFLGVSSISKVPLTARRPRPSPGWSS
jgi:DNA mismatch endonuclease (patch repair protein)